MSYLVAEEQWMVRSHWPDGTITEAVYSTRALAELETYLRQRYSGCQVEPLTHPVRRAGSMGGRHMSPADLDAIRRELLALAELDVGLPGHLRRYTDAWANVGRHVPGLVDEIEQLRIERDDNRAEIAELQERLARADTTPWRPVPDGADPLLDRARAHLVQCGPCDYGVTSAACQCPQGDRRVVIADLVAEVERLRGGES